MTSEIVGGEPAGARYPARGSVRARTAGAVAAMGGRVSRTLQGCVLACQNQSLEVLRSCRVICLRTAALPSLEMIWHLCSHDSRKAVYVYVQ